MHLYTNARHGQTKIKLKHTQFRGKICTLSHAVKHVTKLGRIESCKSPELFYMFTICQVDKERTFFKQAIGCTE